MNVPSTSMRGYTILLIRILNNQTVSSGHVIKRAYESHFRGGSRGGGAPGARPLKLEKIRFVGVKS